MKINKNKIYEDKDHLLSQLNTNKFKILNIIYKIIWWVTLINILFLVSLILYKIASPYVSELAQYSPDKINKSETRGLVLYIIVFLLLKPTKSFLIKVYNRYVI